MPPPPSEMRSGARLKITLIATGASSSDRSRHAYAFASNQSSVRTIASRIVSVGAQPSARMRVASRWISGLSPAQPRAPAGVLDLGREAQVLGDDRDRVVDDDRLVGAEVVDVGARLVRRGARPRSGSPTTQSCTYR